jgi:hypothetical protein
VRNCHNCHTDSRRLSFPPALSESVSPTWDSRHGNQHENAVPVAPGRLDPVGINRFECSLISSFLTHPEERMPTFRTLSEFVRIKVRGKQIYLNRLLAKSSETLFLSPPF